MSLPVCFSGHRSPFKLESTFQGKNLLLESPRSKGFSSRAECVRNEAEELLPLKGYPLAVISITEL